MSALPFSPLTDAELRNRAHEHAFMTVGALVAWADGPRWSEPSIAIEHARMVVAMHDAEERRERRPVGRVR